MSQAIRAGDVRVEQFDWGTIGWRLVPASGASHLMVMDVTLIPGGGHDFHRHPGQEEMIIVKRGRITQYMQRESADLGAGDSVFVGAGVVHASFNDSAEPAELQIAIAPPSAARPPTGSRTSQLTSRGVAGVRGRG